MDGAEQAGAQGSLRGGGHQEHRATLPNALQHGLGYSCAERSGGSDRLLSGRLMFTLSPETLTFPWQGVAIIQADAVAKLLLQNGDYLLSVRLTQSRVAVGLVAHQKGIVVLSI